MADTGLKQKIETSLQQFSSAHLAKNTADLLSVLGYQSQKRIELSPNTPQSFLAAFDRQNRFNTQNARLDEWQTVDFLFQWTDEEARGALSHQHEKFNNKQVDNTQINSYLFFAIQLCGTHYTRTQLAGITRAVNKLFPMPVMLLFQHGETVTLSIIARRLHKRDQSKDVLEKVTLIKDICTPHPNRAHIEILHDLSIAQLSSQHSPTNFVELQHAWEKTLDTSELNKRFYREIANWYFWAKDRVTFPAGAGEDVETRNATSVIRLITRLIFVWFLKEKGLVPDDLFNQRKLEDILIYSVPKGSTYYKAILQNLFFATLNQDMNTPQKPDRRKFRGKTSQPTGRDQHHMITNLYRYEANFKNPQGALALFASIPFLNGGLFECLDKETDPQAHKAEIRIDGFSDRSDNPLVVEDDLFFGKEREIDLNAIYDTRNKTYKVRGLIDIFESYKFTIEENTPIEEEIALDPELLGKVFENLLASYNPETGTTARKQTGSFYTPREIVSYMVDESLLAYLQTALAENSPPPEADALSGFAVQPALIGAYQPAMGLTTSQQSPPPLEERLRHLLEYNAADPQFNPLEKEALITAIDNIKVLDPACGSGAFPMGVLHKLVYVLSKLDKDNIRWHERQRQKTIHETEETYRIGDKDERQARLLDIDNAFEDNASDYGRKLYLIENCIYGVDIQPIAVQISKLRFFISLVVDQKIDDSKENRGIRPLPNLETKFVAANSLIGLERPVQKMLRNPAIDHKEAELAQVRKKHFAARTLETKRKYRQEDEALRKAISILLKEGGWQSATAERLAHWNPYAQNTAAGFFDPEWMFDIVDGFDIVIGNPPYIKEYTYRDAFNGLRNSQYYQGKMDLWYFFACKSLDYLHEGSGILAFIATNNWVTNSGASILRNKITYDAKILRLLDFGDFKIFENAGIQTMVLVCLRNNSDASYNFDLRKLIGVDCAFKEVINLLTGIENPSCQYLSPTIHRKSIQNQTFVFSESKEEQLLLKISGKSNFHLDENREIATGIDVHQDFVNNSSKAILGYGFNIGDGIFIISTKEKKDLSFVPNELELIKPYYTTNELFKYFGNIKNSFWIIYTNSSFKYPKNILPFPNIKRHLDKFESVITSDNYPYGLHRSRNEFFFKGEKIISLRKCAEPTFTYTDFDCYVSQTYFVIKTNGLNSKYLTGLLNSKLIAFWLRRKGKMQGFQYQIDKEPLLSIPLIAPSHNIQKEIADIVDQIILMKQSDLNSETMILENKIDKWVYDLYGLTKNEIDIISH